MNLFDVDLSKTAIRYSCGIYSYKELNNDVNLLTNYFINKGIHKITIFLDKKYEAYCILWAAYKAGATFCSIDTDLPISRVKECISLFKSDLVITEKMKNDFEGVFYQDLFDQALSLKSFYDEHIYPVGNSVMYVLFTSGSTGKPKGVAILRKAFEEVIEWAKNNIGMTSKDIVGQFCNLGFDMGLCDVFLALSVGAEIIPISGISKLTPGRMIKKYSISYLYSVPTVMNIFEKQQDFEKGNLNSLRLIGFGGAPLYEKYMQYICDYRPLLTIFNTYGPTETTLFTSCIIFTATEYQLITEKSVCLGNPITGVNYEIVDYNDNIGELKIIGNHCLAGYLREDEEIDFQIAKPREYFKTGDLVYKENGNYFFVTRKDNQVKVRGNRIELDGIDSYLNIFGITSLSMLIDERLVVFLTDKFSNIEIRDILKSYLPHNCLPDDLVNISEIPLNVNGKFDKAELLNYYNSYRNKS